MHTMIKAKKTISSPPARRVRATVRAFDTSTSIRRSVDRQMIRRLLDGKSRTGKAGIGLQRKCAGCEAKAQGAQESIQAVQNSSGRAMSGNERAFFEPRFGADFGAVRIHEGSTADTAARSVSARAYTLGTNIVMRKGAYQAGSYEGNKLLAHELTHVVQQNGGQSNGAQRVLQRQEAGEAGSKNYSCSMTAKREPLGTGFCISGKTDAPAGTPVTFRYIPGLNKCQASTLKNGPSFGATVAFMGRFYFRTTNIISGVPGAGRLFGAVIGDTVCCTRPKSEKC